MTVFLCAPGCAGVVGAGRWWRCLMEVVTFCVLLFSRLCLAWKYFDVLDITPFILCLSIQLSTKWCTDLGNGIHSGWMITSQVNNHERFCSARQLTASATPPSQHNVWNSVHCSLDVTHNKIIDVMTQQYRITTCWKNHDRWMMLLTSTC